MRMNNRHQQGMVMLIVLLILMGVSLIGLASLMVVGTDLRLSGHFKRSAQAFWAAEAGLQEALGTLRENRDYVGSLGTQTLTNGATFAVSVEVLSPTLKRVIATGRQQTALRRIEAVVNTDSAFASVLNCGGDLRLEGKPRISAEGIRLNGDGYMDLDAGTPDINLYMPPDKSLTATGDTSALHRIEKPPMDLSAIKLSDEDWRTIAASANARWSYDTDGAYGTRDTNVTLTDLDFNNVQPGPDGHRTIFVDGDVTINGNLSGTGTVVATGKIICTGNFRSGQDATVSFIAQDDVLINYDTNAQSFINGLVYTEGDYELHGKIKFTGVVTAFGSVTIQNPSQFTNNSDPNFWYTYSPAYSVIADAVDVLAWSEITP